MKKRSTIFAFLIFAATLTACQKDDEVNPDVALPTISNLEVGLNNNEIGVIGKDFHFNADVLAATKIENVQIRILPRAGESYSKTWSHEITWDSYKDVKNTTIHKHFDIPTDAVEGKYDFLIIVNDQNGSKLEIKKGITIYAAENVPVSPTASIFTVFKNDERFYRNGKFITEGSTIKSGEKFTAQVTISNVKGDGRMYLLLINKKLNHRPESMDKIDFSKVIVYDTFEHKGWANSDFFSNYTFDAATNTPIRNLQSLAIGATADNNSPQANPINGSKAWESGNYYFGVVYLNTTHNIGFFQYIEVPVIIN